MDMDKCLSMVKGYTYRDSALHFTIAKKNNDCSQPRLHPVDVVSLNLNPKSHAYHPWLGWCFAIGILYMIYRLIVAVAIQGWISIVMIIFEGNKTCFKC